MAAYIGVPFAIIAYGLSTAPQLDILVNLSMIAVVVLSIFALSKIISYIPASFLLSENPGQGIIKCLRQASKIMKPYKGYFFVLYLSTVGFIAILQGSAQLLILSEGLSLLVNIILGISIFFLVPYFLITAAVFFNNIRAIDGFPPDMKGESLPFDFNAPSSSGSPGNEVDGSGGN